MRSGEAQSRSRLREEDGDARHQERAGQALDDGIEQGIEICFRAEAAAKLDQCLAVVVALAVKGAIDPALDAALERVEDGGGDKDGDPESPSAYGLWQAVVNQYSGQGDDAEVAAEQSAVASV